MDANRRHQWCKNATNRPFVSTPTCIGNALSTPAFWISTPACREVIAFSPSNDADITNHKLFYWPDFDDPIISAQSRRTTRNESSIKRDLAISQSHRKWDNEKHGRDLSIIFDTRFIPSVIRARKLLIYRPIALGKSRIILSPPWISVFPRAFFLPFVIWAWFQYSRGAASDARCWLDQPRSSKPEQSQIGKWPFTDVSQFNQI